MLTLADAKAHLNVTFDTDDALITAKLAAASDWVAIYTGAEITDSTPKPVNEAILQLTAHLYANREASLIGMVGQSLPMGFLDLLEPYRAWCF
jgi:uncharacterized phage protein (predicted DNA packaging)